MSRSGFRNGPTTTLYVRGIPDRIRHEDLKRAFGKYGRVLDITIPLDYYSGLSKGYCFVEYDDIRDSEEAQYRMDRSRIFGKEIDVEFSKGQRKTPGEMRVRDRDRRYGDDRREGSSRYDRYSRSRSRSPPPPPRSGSSRHADRGEVRRERRRRSPSHEADPPYRKSRSRSVSPPPRINRSRSASPVKIKIERSPISRGRNMPSNISRSRSRSGSPN